MLASAVAASLPVQVVTSSVDHDTTGEKRGENMVDVLQEARSVANSQDLLKVLHVTKAYGGKTVVDDVSLGVARDTVFALLGPNGAGKTTTFNVIR